MTFPRNSYEHIIQELVAKGNDEMAVRLTLQLVDLLFIDYTPQIEQERISTLLKRGRRYLMLASQMSVSYEKQKLWAQAARDDFSAVIEQVPSSSDGYAAHYCRGFIYTYTPLQNDDLALADFHVALQNPNHADHAVVYYHRSIVHLHRKAYDQAVADARHAYELEPFNHDYMDALSHAESLHREQS